MHAEWDEQTDNCVSWQTITTNNQTEAQQLINIHWQNVSHSDTSFGFYRTLCTCQVGKWNEDNTVSGSTISTCIDYYSKKQIIVTEQRGVLQSMINGLASYVKLKVRVLCVIEVVIT